MALVSSLAVWEDEASDGEPVSVLLALNDPVELNVADAVGGTSIEPVGLSAVAVGVAAGGGPPSIAAAHVGPRYNVSSVQRQVQW